MRRPVVALLTDYGPGSEHVGALHAAIAGGCPEADRIDLAHDIPPGDVRRGALVLARLATLVPARTVFLAVVDPGVGGDRRGVVVALASGGALVGPDNGLLGLAAERLGAVAATALITPVGAAATFHGRDVFAPAAAELACGRRPGGLAIAPGSLQRPDLPPAHVAPGRLDALVVGADRFGNVELLAGPEELRAAGFGAGDRLSAVIGDDGRPHPATMARTFADLPRGALLVYADSGGAVALAVRGGDAAARLGAEAGQTLTLARGV